MVWAFVGLGWLWIKNKGGKSIIQLKKENPDYEQTGVDILWSIWLVVLILLFSLAVIYGFTVLYRYFTDIKHFFTN